MDNDGEWEKEDLDADELVEYALSAAASSPPSLVPPINGRSDEPNDPAERPGWESLGAGRKEGLFRAERQNELKWKDCDDEWEGKKHWGSDEDANGDD